MSRQTSLVKNTAILSLGTFFPRFITVFITPILTAQLTKAEYGNYDLVSTVVSLLLPVVTLQVSAAAFRFLIDKREKTVECRRIISTIYAFVLISSVLACRVYYFVVRDRFGLNGLLVCMYFLADILLVTTQQIARGLGKNLDYSISTIIRAATDVFFIALLTGIIPAMKNCGLTGVLWAMFLSTSAALLFLFFKGRISQYIAIKEISRGQLKELLAYSWPMVPNNLSLWVLRLSDRLVITSVLGIEANAVYAVANKLPSIFSAFQSTFTLAWQENASIAVGDEDKDSYYSQMFDWIFSLLSGVMAILIAGTPIIWKLLIRGDYEQGYYQLPILYLGVMFSCMSSTLGGIYVAHMKTKSIGITTMSAAVINLLIDLLFVRNIGIWAGSISTLSAYLFLFVFRMIDVQNFQKVYINIKKVVLSLVLLAAMAVLNFQRAMLSDFINIFVAIVVLTIFDRSIIVMVLKMIKRKLLK